MTTNQIAYAKLKEDTRHNLVGEDIERGKAQSAAVTAQAAASQATTAARRATEEARHNLEGERVNWFTAYANQTHQQSTRQIQQYQADTQARYYDRLLALNTIDAQTRARQAAVQERQATVSEKQLGINARHATAAEAQARASLASAQAQLQNVEVRKSELAESMRHATVVEAEQHRANVVGESIRAQEAEASSRRAATAAREAGTHARQAGIAEGQLALGYENLGVAQQQADTQDYLAKFRGMSDLARSISSIASVYATFGGY